MKKKIGILGSGAVAKALAKGFLKYGYEVMLGTRDIVKLNEFIDKANVGSFEDTAIWAETLVLACKGTAAEDVIKLAGVKNLKDKTIIDTTNPISDSPPDNGVLKFFTSYDESLMEKLQVHSQESNFVKCFSSVGSALMVDPEFKEGKPTMFICGNNPEAKKEVEGILEKFGWETEDLGGVQAARAIEPLCILWCIPGFLNNQWTHAFKLLKK
ncbi:MAG: NAD(P)-binding domain-containing protein [Ignavibacteria bacterium]|nr:NAD(P)-binding domain-containing protein [Ignavibacteria bacterium]